MRLIITNAADDGNDTGNAASIEEACHTSTTDGNTQAEAASHTDTTAGEDSVVGATNDSTGTTRKLASATTRAVSAVLRLFGI